MNGNKNNNILKVSFCLIEDFLMRITSSLYILRIDKESYSEKSDILTDGVRRVFQLVAGKKSFDGENENKRPDVSRTKTHL